MAVESVPIAYSEAGPLYCAIVPSNLPHRKRLLVGMSCGPKWAALIRAGFHRRSSRTRQRKQ